MGFEFWVILGTILFVVAGLLLVLLLVLATYMGATCLFLGLVKDASKIQEKRRAYWDLVAAAHGGELIEGSLLVPDQLRLPFPRGHVSFSLTGSGGKSKEWYTDVKFHSDVTLPCFTAHPIGGFQAFATQIGFSDIEIGDSFFDDDYLLRSSDAERTKTALGPASLVAVRAIRTHAGQPFRFEVSASGLFIRRRGWLEDEEAMLRHIQLCTELFDALAEASGATRAIAESDRAPDIGGTVDEPTPVEAVPPAAEA